MSTVARKPRARPHGLITALLNCPILPTDVGPGDQRRDEHDASNCGPPPLRMPVGSSANSYLVSGSCDLEGYL